MKTRTVIFVAMCLSVSFAKSQDKANADKRTTFFAGPQVSIAAGDLSKTHSWGIGVNTQVVHNIDPKNAVLGKVSYTYLFGKKFTYGYYEPGGPSNRETSKYKGMNDINISGGVRHSLNENWFGSLDAGLCMGFSSGESESSFQGELEFGYLFHCGDSPLLHGLAGYFNLCGDPKLQIGIRYSIGF